LPAGGEDARVTSLTAGVRIAIAAPVVLAAIDASTITPAARAPSTVFALPAPTGEYTVGTTTFRLIDTSRLETLSGAREARNVEVLAWYPAASTPREPDGAAAPGTLAPYLREGLPEVRSFAKMFQVADTTFDALAAVRTHAIVDAPPAARPRRFPALVFSHGYTGVPSASTALLEDLASHGYVVLSIVHPYEATAATLADGRVASMLDATGAPIQGVRDVFAEWAAEDSRMAAVTAAATKEQQLDLMRQYLRTLTHTGVALRRWVDDTKVVLDQLSALPSATRAGQVAGRIDLTRLGVFGHSMGGVTAAQFCIEDRRCRAGLNLDGIPQYGPMIDAAMPRPFLMVYSARPGRLGASDIVYRRATHPYIRVDVADTRHLDFTDMAFWGGPLRDRPVLGAIAPDRIAEITRTVVRQYFDQALLGRRSPLLAGTQKLPEVAVRTVPR
jgi:alpha-beta hydrolase superfamily lysophospholipase